MVSIQKKTKGELDLDEYFGITQIKRVIYFKRHFYIIANKRHEKLGIYVLKLPEWYEEERDISALDKEGLFLVNYKNALDIGDVNLDVLEDPNEHDILIISYKTIYISLYTIMVIDLVKEKILYQHESFCLWESFISSFLQNSKKDFITLDQSGLGVMSLND